MLVETIFLILCTRVQDLLEWLQPQHLKWYTLCLDHYLIFATLGIYRDDYC